MGFTLFVLIKHDCFDLGTIFGYAFLYINNFCNGKVLFGVVMRKTYPSPR